MGCLIGSVTEREKSRVEAPLYPPMQNTADKWSASSRELYRSILERADSIVYVSRAYHKNCMLERNCFMAEHSDLLLAVYNGLQRSGTGATMNYAKKMGRKIIVIDPNCISLLHFINSSVSRIISGASLSRRFFVMWTYIG